MHRLLLCLLLAASAWGADRAGPYAGVGYGAALYDDDGRFAQTLDDRSDVLRFYAGAYIAEFLSVEAGYTLFGTVSGRLGEAAHDESFEILAVSVLFHRTVFAPEFDGYVRVGAGEVRWKESSGGAELQSDSGGSLLYGAGMGYRLRENLTLRFEAVRTDFTLSEPGGKYRMHLDAFMAMLEVQF